MRSIERPLFSISLGLLLVCVLGCPLGKSQVLTQRYDLARSGVNANETTLTLSNVNSANFGKLFSFPVDGRVFAQPLYVPALSIPGNGTHNVVFVATMHDSVYAFDADGLISQPLWQARVAALGCPQGFTCTSVPTGHNYTDNAPDTWPEIGILSTPVIDPTTNTIYVVAKTQEVSGSTTNYIYRLHALDTTTGAERSGSPVVIQGKVPGTGTPNSGGFLVFSPQYSLQRPGLALVNNNIYVAFGSAGDDLTWHGWMFGYSKSSLAQTAAFAPVPNGSEGLGGIWMHGNGIAADANGNLYFSTGNGGFDGSTNFGDSYLKLSTPGLTIADYFTPYNQQDLDTIDEDIASGGLTLLPDSAGTTKHPHVMIGCGKNGAIYVIDRDNLGQFNSANDNQIIQELLNVIGDVTVNPLSTTDYVEVCYSSPTYWQGHVYIGGIDDSLKMFDFSNALLSTSAVSQSSTSYQYPGTNPVVSANGSSNGIVWAIENSGTPGVDSSGTTAILHAYDSSNLSNELYNSAEVASDAAGAPVKHTVPTIANGKVYIGTQSSVAVYGLFSSMSQTAAPTFSPPPGTYSSTASVTISDATSGATIYYTTDGSTPTSNSNVYSSPILVTTSTVINAMAVAPGFRNSQISSGAYIIGTGSILVDSSSAGQATPSASSLSWTHTVSTAGNSLLVVGASVGKVPDTGLNLTAKYNGVAMTSAGVVHTNNQTSGFAQLFYLVNPPSGAHTVTLTLAGGAAEIEAGSVSFIGVNQSRPIGNIATNFGAGTSGSVAVASASEDMVIDVVGRGGAIATSTQTLRWIDNQNGSTGAGNAAQSTASGAPSVTMGYTFSGNDWWGMIAADVVAASSSVGVPAAPTNVTATAGNAQVALNWSASSGATSYNVKRSTTSGGPYTTIASPTTTSYTNTGLTNGTTYYYVVSAVNTAGESSNSSQVSATPSGSVSSTVTLDSSSAGQATPSASSLSWTHTVGSAGNPLLVVGASVGKVPDTGLSLTAKYNGVAMTSAGVVHTNNQTSGFAQLFYLVNPPTGAHTVTLTLAGGAAEIEAGSVSFTGVNQSRPIGNIATNFGAGTSGSVAVASASGDMVIDVVGRGGAIATSTQTLRWLDNQNGSTGAGNAAQSTASGAPSVTMGYTFSTNDWWGMIAADVVAGP
jgi:Chitobiase/beta-hexosaminidase C-terminal domain/Fibronectin type III domain